MKNVNIIAHYNGENIVDGSIFNASKYCHNRMKKRKKTCLEFQSSLHKDNEFIICPDGFSCYKHNEILYISMFTEDCDKKKVLPKIKNNEILFFTKSQIVSLLNLQTDKSDISDALDDTLHDVKKLNGFMIDIVNSIDYKSEKSDVKNAFETIKQWSLLTKSRLNLYDVSNRSFLLNQGIKVDKHIFKLFDAIKKSFESIGSNGVTLKINSKDRIDFNINVYSTFQLLPFILLDNAIKFSPNNEKVHIEYVLKGKYLIISISSIGPMHTKSEILKLTERGYRGESENVLSKLGSGLGLFIAKDICEVNNVLMEIFCQDNVSENYDGYCTFIVKIKILKKNLVYIPQHNS